MDVFLESELGSDAERRVHSDPANRAIALFVIISIVFATSCTNPKVHPINKSLPQETLQEIEVGDTVKITTYSGEQYTFKVDMITEEAIEGEGYKVLLTDIERIKEVHFTGRKVAAAVGIIALLVLLVWLGSNSESQGDNRHDQGASAK
jgi:hypothetical protein